MTDMGMLTIAMVAGVLRVSTPFLFVSLGECLTEKSGRINLGLEGALVLGAMTAFATSYETGNAWAGVAAAALAGLAMGALHGAICLLPRVNDIAVGIAMMSFGTSLAFFLGKPYIQPSAPRLPSLPIGEWVGLPSFAYALDISPLFLVGVALAFLLDWMFRNTRVGLAIRVTGDDASAARALGIPVQRVRFLATACGGAFAGVGGSFLSLYYPGSWNEALSSGQGLMAVALVIFSRWQPRRCLLASLLFGAAGALGPALQSIGIAKGYYFFNAAPYILTLFIMAGAGRTREVASRAPGELSLNNR